MSTRGVPQACATSKPLASRLLLAAASLLRANPWGQDLDLAEQPEEGAVINRPTAHMPTAAQLHTNWCLLHARPRRAGGGVQDFELQDLELAEERQADGTAGPPPAPVLLDKHGAPSVDKGVSVSVEAGLYAGWARKVSKKSGSTYLTSADKTQKVWEKEAIKKAKAATVAAAAEGREMPDPRNLSFGGAESSGKREMVAVAPAPAPKRAAPEKKEVATSAELQAAVRALFASQGCGGSTTLGSILDSLEGMVGVDVRRLHKLEVVGMVKEEHRVRLGMA